MDNKTRWTAIGAASLLGVGMLTAGAAATANAISMVDSLGQPAGLDRISNVENATDVPRFVGSPASVNSVASVLSVNSTNSPTSPTSTPSAPSAPSAVSVPSPVSPVSAPSAPSPASPVSAPSAASVGSSD